MTADEFVQFELSRVYAQGWNAARTLPASSDSEAAANLNPYISQPKRGRWCDGFADALA